MIDTDARNRDADVNQEQGPALRGFSVDRWCTVTPSDFSERSVPEAVIGNLTPFFFSHSVIENAAALPSHITARFVVFSRAIEASKH